MKKKVDKLLRYEFENILELENIMETLSDLWLLTKEWKEVRHQIREITTKDVEDNIHVLERWRKTFSKEIQQYLLLNRKCMNPTTKKFLDNKFKEWLSQKN